MKRIALTAFLIAAPAYARDGMPSMDVRPTIDGGIVVETRDYGLTINVILSKEQAIQWSRWLANLYPEIAAPVAKKPDCGTFGLLTFGAGCRR